MPERATLLKQLLLVCVVAGGCECLPASRIACNPAIGSQCPDNYTCSTSDGPGFCVGSSGGAAPQDAGGDGGSTVDAGVDAGRPIDGGPDASLAEDAGMDAGVADAGVDAGDGDAGFGTDAGEMDAGAPPDAGADAGASDDAGTDAGILIGLDGGADAGSQDAGAPDAGPSDGGPSDAGPSDAGPSDAGPSDAGPSDAGPPVDAGPIDAGPVDAGPVDAGPVDAGPPPPTPDTTPDAGIVYLRTPWGVDGGSPSFVITGSAGTASGDAFVVAYDGANPATANLIGGPVPVQGDGSFQMTLASGDRSLVFLAGENGQQTLTSATTQVHDVIWTATFGGKISGSISANPHTLYEAQDFNVSAEGLGDAGAAVFVQQGPLTQDPSLTSEATMSDYVAASAADFRSVGVDALLAVWYDRTPSPGGSPVPALIQSAMAYDAARGRTVLFGGTGSQNQTYEWDGHIWTVVNNGSNPSAVPSARFGHAMAYDAACGCTLLFGGEDSNSRLLNDTWEWDGSGWTNVTGQSLMTPAAREGHTMAYDAVRGVVVMFGGYDTTGSADAETWEWTAGQWIQRTAASPPPRCFAGMDFDSFRGRTVLYGGQDCTGNMSHVAPDTDLWEWDGATWTNPHPSGGPPSGLSGFGMAFDVQHAQSVLFGGDTSATPGQLSGTLWTWDGTQWGTTAASGPSARDWNCLAYDSSRKQVLSFGGRDESDNTLAETWAWTGTIWENTTPGTTSPRARQNHAMAFDRNNGVTVLFGGAHSTGGLENDTWLWNGWSWTNANPSQPPPARQGHAMSYDIGNKVTLMVGGVESNVVNDTWLWDGTSWTNVSPSLLINEAPSVQEAGIAYDSLHGQTVLFGGTTSSAASGGATNGTSLWTGSTSAGNWAAQLVSEPPTRYQPAMTFNLNGNYALLFGGFSTSWEADTWEWNGSSWSSPTTTVAPNPGSQSVLVFDTGRELPLLFGGVTMPSTWVWTGTAWNELTQTGTPTPQPSGRTGFAMAYDSNRQATVLFGGMGSTLLADTWELPTENSRRPAGIAEFSFGAANTQGNAVVQLMSFSAIAGGVGDRVGSTTLTYGAQLAVWDATGGGWRALASNAIMGGGSISYTTTSPAEAQRYVLLNPQTINVAVYPTGSVANGTSAKTPSIGVDYVQLTVRYVQP